MRRVELAATILADAVGRNATRADELLQLVQRAADALRVNGRERSDVSDLIGHDEDKTPSARRMR